MRSVAWAGETALVPTSMGLVNAPAISVARPVARQPDLVQQQLDRERARLRHETFFALAILNGRIRELLADLNGRVMRQYQASRRELFERLDRPALRPLPAEPFVYGEWKTARVNIDYHVELHRHYYSVPFALVHEVVDTRLTKAPRPSPPRHRPATGGL